MTLPSTDLLYLREDERAFTPAHSERVIAVPAQHIHLLQSRLIESRKNCERQLNELEAEIERLQIASGEVIGEIESYKGHIDMPQSTGDEVV